ncbi:MAG: patatin-like phospholipase family protein [Pleomorphochaeta sp.]
MNKKIKILFLSLLFSISSIYATYPKVALVLSGGGAKGFSQVAVVEEIQKLGIPIDFICGTSMGGLIGAYYALGYSASDIKEMIKNNSIMKAVLDAPNANTATPPSLSKKNDGLKLSLGINSNGIGDSPGLLSDQGIVSYLNRTTIKSPGEISFLDLYIPFMAMSVDIETGKEKILDHGYISDAMRATMSLPIIFPPYQLKDGTYCMDGGLVDNLPVKLAQDWGADIIISVDVSSEDLKGIEGFSSLSGIAIQTSHLVTLSNREDSQNASDIVIKPDVSGYLILDLGKFDEILEKGYEAVDENREELIAIRDEIEKYRELDFVDQSKQSYYSQIKEPLVNSVKFVGISYDKSFLFSNIFDKYIGERLDDKKLDLLNKDVKAFASLNGISTVTYNFNSTDKETNEGFLEIGIRDWENSPSKIDFIALTKMGFSSNPINRAWFYNSFNIHSEIKEIFADRISLDLDLNFSEVTELDSKVGYLLLDKKDYELINFFDFYGALGSLSPANNKYITNYLPSFSYGFKVGAGLDLRFSNKLSLETVANYNLYLLSDTTLPDGLANISFESSILNYFSLELSFAYLNSEESIFSLKGLGLKGIGMITFEDSLNYYGLIKGKFDIPINDKNTIKLNLESGFSSTNYELTSSYFDLGGYTMIPGFYYGAYTREYFLINLAYQRYLIDWFVPLYMQAGLKFYGYDDYNPINYIYLEGNTNMIEAPSSSIPSITDLGLGVYCGVGFDSEIGQIILGTGYSLNGNFSVVLEFV